MTAPPIFAAPDETAIEVDCTVEAGDWPPADTLVPLIETAIAAAARTADLVAGGEVSVLLTDDAHIRALNAKWRGKDKATNVLSFPANAGAVPDGPVLFGDIVLARETVLAEAETEGKAIDHHVAHLLVHGFLHLLGYDHETPEEADAMEELERRALAGLAIRDPYA